MKKTKGIIAALIIVVIVGVGFITLNEKPTVTTGSYEAPTLGGEQASETVEITNTYTPTNILKAAVSKADMDNAYTSIEACAIDFRRNLVKREPEIRFAYIANKRDDSIIAQIWAKALEHTGVPTEGDYLNFQLGGYTTNYTTMESNGRVIYTFTYYPKYYTTLEEEKEMDTKIKEVMASLKLDGKSNYQKSKAIYKYITSHVTYDYSGGAGYTRYTAYGALVKGTAVCQGYANLYYRMALEAGVDARIVRSYQINHAWNVSKGGSKYYYLSDSTWDAGVSASYYTYFMRGSSDFNDHYNTDDNYADTSFKSEYRLSKKKYGSK